MTEPIGQGAPGPALLRALKGVESMRAAATGKPRGDAADMQASPPEPSRPAVDEPGRAFPRGSFVDVRV